VTLQRSVGAADSIFLYLESWGCECGLRPDVLRTWDRASRRVAEPVDLGVEAGGAAESMDYHDRV
jgi:hypothetical protein